MALSVLSSMSGICVEKFGFVLTEIDKYTQVCLIFENMKVFKVKISYFDDVANTAE
jgi:hypothetical protein